MRRFTIILAILAITLTSQAEEKPMDKASTSASYAEATADKTDGKQGRHLFILSGQSNMHRLDSTLSFAPAVEEAFGKDNVTVVKSARSGAAIRFVSRSKRPVAGWVGRALAPPA